ncbi:hypothetical protein ACH9L7_04870 [Haloferax sp. S1W]
MSEMRGYCPAIMGDGATTERRDWPTAGGRRGVRCRRMLFE